MTRCSGSAVTAIKGTRLFTTWNWDGAFLGLGVAILIVASARLFRAHKVQSVKLEPNSPADNGGMTMKEQIHIELTTSEVEEAVSQYLKLRGYTVTKPEDTAPVFRWDYNRSNDPGEPQGLLGCRVEVTRSNAPFPMPYD